MVLSHTYKTASKSVEKKGISKVQQFFSDDKRFLLVILLPVVLFFLVWNALPTMWMVGMSFYDYSMISATKTAQFIGLENFIYLLGSESVWSSISKTFLFVVLGVGIETILGILLGFLFWNSAKMPGRRLALTLLFSPMILAPIAIANYFKLMTNPNFGVISYIISLFNGGKAIELLTDVNLAFPTCLGVDIWMWTPFMLLMTLAALGSVPKAELEAANIDRLGWGQKFKHIILPHGKYILMLGIMLRTIDCFKTMDLVWAMTTGGPGAATELLGISLYRVAFQSLYLGRASAYALITLLVAIAFTSIFLFILNKKNSEVG
ncbi:MAG: sugar ABC transporter permease [Clostridiales bacterium]|nr:sugar ABC transporter permease [Clostridiales bacterium]